MVDAPVQDRVCEIASVVLAVTGEFAVRAANRRRLLVAGTRRARAHIVDFEVISRIWNVQVIAMGPSLRVRWWLIERFGSGSWRKLKGIAIIRLHNGKIRRAELHWYESHGIGRRDMKIKRLLVDE